MNEERNGREDWPEDYAAPPIPADVVLPMSAGAARPDDYSNDTQELRGDGDSGNRPERDTWKPAHEATEGGAE